MRLLFYLLIVLLSAPAAAGVIVLENRSDEAVTMQLGAEGAVELELAPLEVKAFRTNGAVPCVYETKQGQLRYRLEPNQLYAYERDLLGRRLLQAVEFPEPDDEAPEAGPPADAAGSGSAKIRVKLYVDEENPQRTGSLQPALLRRVKAASDVIAKNCGVSFEVIEVGRWESDNTADTPDALRRDFAQKVAVEPGELAIGFTSQAAANRRQPYPVELPEPLSSHLLLYDWQGGSTEGERVAILLQQLAGWLGAELTPEQASIMRPLTGEGLPRNRELAFRIDGANTLAMNLVAEQIQNHGARRWDDLDAAVAHQLRRIRFGLKQARTMLTEGSRRAPRRPAQETDDRYAVMFANGAMLSGQHITHWNSRFTAAEVAGVPIFRTVSPVRWVRLNGVGEQIRPKSFVELVGGDVLPGKVVAYLADRSSGVQRVEQLVVEPAVAIHAPGRAAGQSVHIVLNHVRRIVRDDRRRRFVGKMAFLTNGTSHAYDSIRYAEEGVELLSDGEIEKLAWDELAELQLEAHREWPLHVETLARLNPRLDSPLVTAESLSGVRATGTVAMTRAEALALPDRTAGVYHAIQPAWSASPIWLPQNEVRLYQFFQANELPLSRLSPVAVRQRGYVASGAPWQRDANVAGGRLNSGGYEFAWGLGTQAYCELHFALPAPTVGFQSWIGLDRSVGGGGCAQAKVAVGPTNQRMLFASNILVGSDEVHDTGALRIEPPTEGDSAQRRLVLITDPVIEDRPARADPFEIRDLLNWLEPMLLLDGLRLQQELAE